MLPAWTPRVKTQPLRKRSSTGASPATPASAAGSPCVCLPVSPAASGWRPPAVGDDWSNTRNQNSRARRDAAPKIAIGRRWPGLVTGCRHAKRGLSCGVNLGLPDSLQHSSKNACSAHVTQPKHTPNNGWTMRCHWHLHKQVKKQQMEVSNTRLQSETGPLLDCDRLRVWP